MTKDKKARPVVAATEQANGNAGSSFHEDFTTKQAVGQFLISDYLRQGQENAVSLQELRQWTGIDGRIIRRKIATERLQGIPILADNQTGYFLPATEEERKRCVRSMKHRAKEIYKAAQAIETADISKDVLSCLRPVVTVEEQTAVEGWF